MLTGIKRFRLRGTTFCVKYSNTNYKKTGTEPNSILPEILDGNGSNGAADGKKANNHQIKQASFQIGFVKVIEVFIQRVGGRTKHAGTHGRCEGQSLYLPEGTVLNGRDERDGKCRCIVP